MSVLAPRSRWASRPTRSPVSWPVNRAKAGLAATIVVLDWSISSVGTALAIQGRAKIDRRARSLIPFAVQIVQRHAVSRPVGAETGSSVSRIGRKRQDVTEPPHDVYCRTHITRAIQAISATWTMRSGWLGLSDSNSIVPGGLAAQFLGQHFAAGQPHHDAVAFADAGGGRHDQHVAIAVERFHRIALHFEGESAILTEIGKLDFFPARPAGGHAFLGEEPARARLGHADQRHHGARHAFPSFDEAKEIVQRRIGGREHLRYGFGGGPALAPVRPDPLRAVEARGVEPRTARETRSGESMAFRETVDRGPDLLVGQHGETRSEWLRHPA